MLKTSGWILTAGLVLSCGARAYGQLGLGDPPFLRTAGPLPPETAERQKEQKRLMKEAAPEFYAFQEKLQDIQAKIGKITASLARRQIDKATAKENMLPLIRAEQRIQNDPEFLAEQRLAQVYFSSPEYREKERKALAAFAEKRKAKR